MDVEDRTKKRYTTEEDGWVPAFIMNTPGTWWNTVPLILLGVVHILLLILIWPITHLKYHLVDRPKLDNEVIEIQNRIITIHRTHIASQEELIDHLQAALQERDRQLDVLRPFIKSFRAKREPPVS